MVYTVYHSDGGPSMPALSLPPALFLIACCAESALPAPEALILHIRQYQRRRLTGGLWQQKTLCAPDCVRTNQQAKGLDSATILGIGTCPSTLAFSSTLPGYINIRQIDEVRSTAHFKSNTRRIN